MPRATPNTLESEPTAEGALASANGSAAPVECEEGVIDKIRLRRNAGRKKYGTTMERTDLNRLQWLQHAQEEAMDLAIYLERLMREERQNDLNSATAGARPASDSRKRNRASGSLE